jgi:hypothetical protein
MEHPFLTVDEILHLSPLGIALQLIRFLEAKVARLIEEDIVDDNSIHLVDKKDILVVADSHGKWMPTVNCINFGITLTSRLVGLMHLVQDYTCCGVSVVDGMLPGTLDYVMLAL